MAICTFNWETTSFLTMTENGQIAITVRKMAGTGVAALLAMMN
ncbi:MAG TPA: hypothetical protein PLA26_06275 [Anaerolineaceae bacterium]|nr:hypothetical protein [Anaerolineaceae bacterium]HQK04261.1 hypothetical protein [Anaerolineaceae bacterium]HQL28118.1 hypothetical protein [Anaerolineaceae bacterium]